VLPDFRLVRPTTLEEALAQIGEDALPYAGGTELFIAMRGRLLQPGTLVDLKRVRGLADIRVDDGWLVVGAAATHDAVAGSEAVREHAPLLADVAPGVGNPRVRAAGTVGGNLCFAEPKSDVVTALVALGAELTLASAEDTRTVPAAEFHRGPYWTVREDRELLTEIRIPPAPDRRGVYVKFQTRERPTVGVALVTDWGSGACRLVVGAVGEVPVSLEFPSLGAVDPAAAAEAVDPVADLTESVEYKRHVTAVMAARAKERLEEAVAGAR